MKLLWIILGVVVAVGLILLLPATGFASHSKGDVAVEMNVKAYASSNTDSIGANSIDVAYSNPQNVSYLQYVGIWWGGLIGPGQVINDSVIYVQVHIKILHGNYDGTWTETNLAYGFPYKFGTSFEHTFNFRASHDDKITASLWVVFGDHILSSKSFAGVVP